MTVDYAKEELVRRYKYLYENAYFILAPFMYEETKEEYKKRLKEQKEKYGVDFATEPLIYLKINRVDSINSLFEEFLLSDKLLEESSLYKFVEDKRNDKDYLNRVKKGLELVAKKNKNIKFEMLKNKLGIWELLGKVADYIEEQSGDLKNKERKLYVLDQYYRIARYRNDGKIYTSGRKLNLHDVSSIVVPMYERNPFRDKLDIGIRNNEFIMAIVNAPGYEDIWSIFSENEKQQIYLTYHDELPCDLEITCEIEDKYVDDILDTRLIRPDNTASCGENFIVKEDEIFINQNDNLYRYYQVCPNCGYIVNIPKEILSDGIKQRIENRCMKDQKLFRKMFLYSELFSLDKDSTTGQKRLLKQ